MMRMIACVVPAAVLARDAAGGDIAQAPGPAEKSAPAQGEQPAPGAADEKSKPLGPDAGKTAPSPPPSQGQPSPPAGGGGLIPELI